jgi:toxin ParE1/3/4
MIVTWAVEAERDLVALCDRIALDDPRRALEIGDEIFAAVERLTDLPRRGRPGRVADTRELVLAPLPWIAIYRVDSAAVTILRILHGAQDWPVSEVP